MYSNRSITNIHVNQDTNGKSILQQMTPKPFEKILIELNDFTMPNQMDNITLKNNVFNYDSLLDGIVNIIIPVGHYSSIQLRDYINSQLPSNTILTYADFRYELISTHKITISTLTTCRKILGIDTLPLSATHLPTYTIKFPKKSNMVISPYIFLKIKEVEANMVTQNSVIDSTFCRIMVNSNYGETIFYRPNVKQEFLLRRHTIQSLTIQLEDVLGNILLNDFDCSFNIKFVYLASDPEIELKPDDEFIFQHVDGPIPKMVDNRTRGGFGI